MSSAASHAADGHALSPVGLGAASNAPNNPASAQPAPAAQETSPQPAGVVLMTGGSGYVGGRLIPLLERRDLQVRCLAREPEKLRAHVSGGTDVVQGDVLDAPSLDRALVGVETAYYLVHLMANSDDFEAQDRLAATLFGDAAKRAGVKRIIYLGGLGDDADPELSPHLRSRHEVGKILRESGVETIEFRASVVIGSGSLSFELVRSLTDRLPVMLCPTWLKTPTQPIAVDDVLAYLLAARELPPGESQIIEIGGSDVVGYGDLIREYAKQTGKRRILISVPVLSPYLSSLWLGLVTPTRASVGRHLIEGLKNPTIVHGRDARDLFSIRPMSVREAVRKALEEGPPKEGAVEA